MFCFDHESLPDPGLELDESRMAIRSAAQVWQERDRASSRAENQDRAQATTPTPSRRIGNLFSRSSGWRRHSLKKQKPIFLTYVGAKNGFKNWRRNKLECSDR
jgi:hypothetical protein